MKIKCLFLISIIGAFNLSLSALDTPSNTVHRLWYDHPADYWEATLPLGNGRLGMMPDGQIEKETLVLNDITLWSGSVQDANNPDAAQYLPEIRQLLFEGKNDQAQDLIYKTFVCKGEGSGHGEGAKVPYGSFEILGNLHIDYQYADKNGIVKQYNRQLSLDNAIAKTEFTRNGIQYTREYFADFNQDVLIIKLRASQKGTLNFRVGIDRPEVFETTLDGNELLMKGQLNNGTDGKGMKYIARVSVRLDGPGTVKGTDKHLQISGAQQATLIVSAATDFRNPEFESTCRTLLNKAIQTNYETAKKQHIAAYKNYFDRVNVNLEKDMSRDTIPTDRRLIVFASNPVDNGLIETYFQYGRYLMISSTRPGLLPPNLQGLWANTIQTPWNGDYHLNINVQMNHWPAEITSLSELHQPLIKLIEGLVKPGEETAKVFYHANGWVAHMMTNIWGYTAPGEHPSWGATNTGGAWLCAHLWEHYDYNRDAQYLQEIYPVMKGAAMFFLSTLVVEPKHGWLVTAPSTSPENAFYMPGTKKAVSICMGPTMDNQLVRELFTNVIHASQILNIDPSLREQLQKAVAQLPPSQIGSDGRLMEWLEEYEEPEPQHRHVSLLYGLHPGNQITPEGTPELAAAARKTLDKRGDSGTGWSRAWKINFWARLKDGPRAYKLLRALLDPTIISGFDYSSKGGTYPNLFCAHPPFQIDGNFGGCAGIAEMFIQSHSGIIDLIPAIPDEFASGSFDGLRVRGGAEVSAVWKNKKLVSVSIKATTDDTFQLRLPASSNPVFQKQETGIKPEISGSIATLTLKKGEIVTIRY